MGRIPFYKFVRNTYLFSKFAFLLLRQKIQTIYRRYEQENKYIVEYVTTFCLFQISMMKKELTSWLQLFFLSTMLFIFTMYKEETYPTTHLSGEKKQKQNKIK